MENKKIEKPTILVIEETKEKLADVINNSNLPAFIIEPILSSFLQETQIASRKEYNDQKRQYEAMLKEQPETE